MIPVLACAPFLILIAWIAMVEIGAWRRRQRDRLTRSDLRHFRRDWRDWERHQRNEHLLAILRADAARFRAELDKTINDESGQ